MTVLLRGPAVGHFAIAVWPPIWSVSAMDQSQIIAIATATFFVAGIVKGVTGMGLPTVAMAVLGALFSPLMAAGLLLAPSFFTNIWQLLAGPSFGPILRRLWPMMAAILLGTIAGSVLLVGGDTEHSTAALGCALLLYSTYTLLARPFHVPAVLERWLSPVIGLVTGVVTGATGVFVIPAVPYIQALGFERDELVQALGLSFTVSTIAFGAALLWHGALPATELTMSVLAIIPAMIGMQAGQWLRQRISPPAFRRAF